MIAMTLGISTNRRGGARNRARRSDQLPACIPLESAVAFAVALHGSDRGSDLLGCEETFCHPDERMVLPAEREPRATFLLDIWTAKESVLKALGTGFFLPPEEVMIHLDTTPGTASSVHCRALLADLHIHRPGHAALADHTAFVSTSTRIKEIIFNTDFI